MQPRQLPVGLYQFFLGCLSDHRVRPQGAEILGHVHAAFPRLPADQILLGLKDAHIDFLRAIAHSIHLLRAGLQGRAPFVSADTGELGAAGLHKSHARYPYG